MTNEKIIKAVDDAKKSVWNGMSSNPNVLIDEDTEILKQALINLFGEN